MGPIQRLRFFGPEFWVDVRVRRFGPGRWLASADTPDGPTVGHGCSRRIAVERALDPFEGLTELFLRQLDEEPDPRAAGDGGAAGG